MVNLSLFFLRSLIIATIIVAATDVIVFYYVVGRGIAQITPLFVLLVIIITMIPMAINLWVHIFSKL